MDVKVINTGIYIVCQHGDSAGCYELLMHGRLGPFHPAPWGVVLCAHACESAR